MDIHEKASCCGCCLQAEATPPWQVLSHKCGQKVQQCALLSTGSSLSRLPLSLDILHSCAQVVVNLILCGIIAGLAAALSGAFILPSVAGNELRESIGLALIGIGKSLSGYDQPHHAVGPQPPFTHNKICIP